MAFHSAFKGLRISAFRFLQWNRTIQSSVKHYSIVDGGAGTHKPTPFQGKILVWTKTYKSIEDVPQRVTRSQMRNAMDKFRVQVSIGMIALTFIFAAVFALIGRKERMEGKSIANMTLQKIENMKKGNE